MVVDIHDAKTIQDDMVKTASEMMNQSLIDDIKEDEKSWPTDLLRYVRKSMRYRINQIPEETLPKKKKRRINVVLFSLLNLMSIWKMNPRLMP